MQDLHNTQVGKQSLQGCNSLFKLSINFAVYMCDDEPANLNYLITQQTNWQVQWNL